MNAAARLVHQNHQVSKQIFVAYFLTRKQLLMSAIIFLIVLSAISLVAITHSSRLVYAKYQDVLQETNQLHSQNSKLLLERSTLLMQSRVQSDAEHKLHMVMPKQTSLVIVKQ